MEEKKYTKHITLELMFKKYGDFSYVLIGKVKSCFLHS